jgi:2',3'-cyclic-nucleotide 2'-phosphodiesterase (5'-nucleotidase family)
MDATDEVAGSSVPRRWSQDHTVSAIATWQTDRFGASAALTWHSGWRTSLPPSTLPIGTTLAVDEILNNAHLRDYVSLDVAASASWHVGRSTITLYGDVTNALDRNNVAGVDFAVEDDGTSWIFLPEKQAILPIVASAGLLIAF